MEKGYFVKKIVLFVLVVTAAVLLFNLVITLVPNWQSNLRVSLAMLDYWLTLGYGSFVA